MGKSGYVVLCFIVICFSLILFSGCATTSSVNKRFKEMEARIDENTSEVERLNRKSEATDTKAEDALQKASEALTVAKSGRGPGELKPAGEMKINFEFDNYELSHIAQNVLDEVGKMMQEKPNLILEIMGHTDQAGSERYNLLLGHNRAESAMRYLQEKYSIPLYRMYILSYGKSKPEGTSDSPKERAANRRVVLRLFGS